MKQSTFLFKPVAYIAIAVYIALAYSILATGNNLIAATIPEDHYFELVGAFSFLVTSLLFFMDFGWQGKPWTIAGTLW